MTDDKMALRARIPPMHYVNKPNSVTPVGSRLYAIRGSRLGSDSLLVQFGRRLGLVLQKESTSCSERSNRRHWFPAALL